MTDDDVAPTEVDRFTAMDPAGSSAEVRGRLVDLLRRDLVGPHPDLDPDLAREVITSATPSTWYLTGYLAPHADAPVRDVPDAFINEDAGEEGVAEMRSEEGLGDDVTASGREDDAPTEPPRRTFLPSSIGLTVLVPEGVDHVSARVTWGDYRPQPPLNEALFLPERADQLEEGELGRAGSPSDREWHRVPREERLEISLNREPHDIMLPGSGTPGRHGADAMVVHVRTRRPREIAQPDGTVLRVRAVSVFVVNRRFRVARRFADIANAHQVRLELACDPGFAPIQDLSQYGARDEDERLADLHYRDERAYATGHNTSADWEANGTWVCTDPLPSYEVQGMRADLDRPGVERGMEALALAAENPDGEVLYGLLAELPRAYEAWATAQRDVLASLPGERRATAERCLDGIATARARIADGIRLLRSDPQSRAAFAIMNRAVARSNRQREAGLREMAPADVRAPSWRLFQLAFILLNLNGLADRTHDDRATVDLLFFPTGGGKTEAYLGLAAFVIAQRRLAHRDLGAGLSVIMRYTLRLLTLDQLSRAAGLVCALELERQGRADLGDWPIEIGLWVGSAATPNRLGRRGNTGPGTLIYWLNQHRRDPRRNPAPLPLKDCPWCGTALDHESFSVQPNTINPARLDLHCGNINCEFSEQRLPVVAVDEEIYRRLPAFMIATVDKFANVAWEGRTGAFFGHVNRRDSTGFFGAAEPHAGQPVNPDEPGQCLPPLDLIIQDELHLISGPLGTVAGLYETAFDLLASREINGRLIGPKIVASTATVRRADAQIRSLFGRSRTEIFPPPGPSRHDSFFAETETEEPGRLYVGIGGPGQGPKRVFLRALQTLLAGAGALSSGVGSEDPADPYLTALCYFNALRELGGARRIVDDEVRRNLSNYGERRMRHSPPGAPFASRELHETFELTSRVNTDQVAAARKALGRPASDAEAAHVALATNMISVGLDIGRLGLMLVQGQPKTTAEYIQATSRVGRSRGKPGLVAVLLNLHKPRDRTHFEQFRAFHASFYRNVEASTVTPFAPRALDRALSATLVSAARHFEPQLTRSSAAEVIENYPHAPEQFRRLLGMKLHTAGLTGAEATRVLDRMDQLHHAWEQIARDATAEGGSLLYDGAQPEQRLLQDPLRPLAGDLDGTRGWFAAARSMRETEPAALLRVRRPNGSSF